MIFSGRVEGNAAIAMITYPILRLLGHQDWIRMGIRNKIIRHFVTPGKTDNYEFKVNYFGFTYRGNLNNMIDWSVYFLGAYEKGLLFILKEMAQKKKDTVFIDIGASVGTHSIFMSKFCKEVHAFESSLRSAQLLKQRLITNNIKNVSVHSLGLSDKNEKLDFIIPSIDCLGMESFQKNTINPSILYPQYELAVGDEYIAQLKIGGGIDIVKIDVEGFEKYVLMGLQNTLKVYRPIIIMEFSEITFNTFSSKNEFVSLLNGYRISELVWDRPFFMLFNRLGLEVRDFSFDRPLKYLLCEPL